MYNEIVESDQWAKAHFFIAIGIRWSVIAKEEIVAKIEEIAERVADPEGIEIVEVQLLGAGRGRLLRIFIDRPVTSRDSLPRIVRTVSRMPTANLFRTR